MKQLHSDQKPAERISLLLQEYIGPLLLPDGFHFLNSAKEFKKKNELFDYHVSWYSSKFNQGKSIVMFDIHVGIDSPNYRKWETKFYGLSERNQNFVAGSRIDNLEKWNKEYYEHGWYDLAKYDNEKVMERIAMNIQTVAKEFFEKFNNVQSAVAELKKRHVANFETIVDLLVMQNKYEEAIDFFKTHNAWHEEQLRINSGNSDTQFAQNRAKPYELRKRKLMEWAQQENYRID